MRYVLIILILALPQSGFACGGLFCNADTPVNQSAERILFSRSDTGLEMHVRITYQGPPTEFGWLLPVPLDVDYGLSADQVFTALDSMYSTRFILRTEVDPGCQQNRTPSGGFAVSGAAGGGDGGVSDESEPDVAVLSREAVGPYDLALLQPATIQDLRRWLDDNGYQIPETADATLTPYITPNTAFIALKLLPTAGSGDVQPLRLSFSGDTPAIPIVPTSVAADPDMGIIVHLLGDSRGVSTNYRHVTINEATIDWAGGGQNYSDVVSQAVDEAGGRAFVTDFAGGHGNRIELSIIADETLAAIGELGQGNADGVQTWMNIESLLLSQIGRNDSDIRRIAQAVVTVPEGIDINDFLRRPRGFAGHPSAHEISVDIEALVEKITFEVNEPRAMIMASFERNPYLTRLYSTMSAEEMTEDPQFGWNRDLPEISNVRNAVRRVRCFMGMPDWENAIIETDSGLRFRQESGSNPNIILRQAGETVRGFELPAAHIIEEQMPAGQPRLVTDNTAQIDAKIGINGGAGCACDASGSGSEGLAYLLLLFIPAGLRRRRLKK
jgi:hypothetical protein